MTPLEVAREWRREGRYELGLACLRALPEDAGVAAETARLLVRLGRSREALVAAERALALAGDGEHRGEALLSLVEAALSLGEPGRARLAAEEAEIWTRARFGEVSVQRGLALDALAATLHSAGDAPAALGPATRAVAILERADPWHHATAWHTLAEAHHRAGQHAQAREAWERCLALRRASLEADHPEIAAALDGLGLTERRLGRPRQAAAAHRAALETHRSRLGPAHPAVAASLHGLAQALHRQGDFQGARSRLREALEVSLRAQGPDHPDVWVTRFELGRMDVDCGDTDGFAAMEAARAHLRATLGPAHPTVQAMDRWL